MSNSGDGQAFVWFRSESASGALQRSGGGSQTFTVIHHILGILYHYPTSLNNHRHLKHFALSFAPHGGSPLNGN